MQETLHPTPMERAILDILARTEQENAAGMARMEERVRTLEADNSTLREQVAALKQTMSDFAALLEGFLAPSGMPHT